MRDLLKTNLRFDLRKVQFSSGNFYLSIYCLLLYIGAKQPLQIRFQAIVICSPI